MNEKSIKAKALGLTHIAYNNYEDLELRPWKYDPDKNEFYQVNHTRRLQPEGPPIEVKIDEYINNEKFNELKKNNPEINFDNFRFDGQHLYTLHKEKWSDQLTKNVHYIVLKNGKLVPQGGIKVEPIKGKNTSSSDREFKTPKDLDDAIKTLDKNSKESSNFKYNLDDAEGKIHKEYVNKAYFDDYNAGYTGRQGIQEIVFKTNGGKYVRYARAVDKKTSKQGMINPSPLSKGIDFRKYKG
jgi:hypothetical protein